MAEQFIEEIYEISKVITTLEIVVENVRLQRDYDALRDLNTILPLLCNLSERCLDEDISLGKQMWNIVSRLLEIKYDFIHISDIIELELLPVYRQWVAIIASIDVETVDGVRIRSSLSGFLNVEQRGFCMHSANNPMLEAFHLVDDFFESGKKTYHVFGCGLGYHVFQLYEKIKGYGKIVLYESDSKMLEYAKQYGVLEWIPKENIDIVQDYDVSDFGKKRKKLLEAVYIHVPTMHALEEGIEKNAITQLWMQENTNRIIEKAFKLNSPRNLALGLQDVGTFIEQMDKKDVIVVAAGPSCKQLISKLVDFRKDKYLIAVGTIYKELMKNGVYPDAVIMVDYDELVLRQIEGLENQEIPLVVGENTYWEVAYNYNGRKYMIGRDRGEWLSGGTVAYAAIQLGISLCVGNMYLVGLDLGYPTKESHAEGAVGYSKLTDSKLFPVEATNGTTVLTDNHLDVYRKTIQNLIVGEDSICFYNLAENGAKILGTEYMSI